MNTERLVIILVLAVGFPLLVLLGPNSPIGDPLWLVWEIWQGPIILWGIFLIFVLVMAVLMPPR